MHTYNMKQKPAFASIVLECVHSQASVRQKVTDVSHILYVLLPQFHNMETTAACRLCTSICDKQLCHST